MKQITIASDKLNVVISTRGAEILSIVDENGVERLWQRDPAFWAGSAPILFPIAGGLKEDAYFLDGKRYPMPKHGYVRTIEWTLEKQEKDSAVFLMTQKAEGFPFDYELRAVYAVCGNVLKVTYSVSNCGKEAFAFGMGAHEGYAIEGELSDYELVFECEEQFENHELVGNLIRREPVLLAQDTNVFPLKEDYFAVDALVFPSLKSREVTLRSRKHDRAVRVSYPQHDVLMLWMKPGAKYLCIEPWLNAPDYLDADMDIMHKPGCLRLEEGEKVERSHTITIV